MKRPWIMPLVAATLTAGCMDLDFSALAGLEGWADCGSGGFMSSCGSSGSSGTPTEARRIHGTVTKDGAPLVGAWVGGGLEQVQTDSLGEYTVAIVAWSDASFEDPTPTADAETRRVTADASHVDTLDVDFTAFDYEVDGVLRADGQPVAGQAVWIEAPPFIVGDTTETDPAGAFRLEGRLIRSQCDSLRIVALGGPTTILGDCGILTVGG